MINFRKLRQDFSPAILKDGRSLYEKSVVQSAKIVSLKEESLCLHCRIAGNYDNAYTCTIEIDREKSSIIDSDCDCTYKYDCQHLAAALYHLEEHVNEILVKFSKETDVQTLNKKEKEILLETAKEAETKEVVKRGKKQLKELLQEYVGASQVLGQSPFFVPEEKVEQDKAELAVIFAPPSQPVVDSKNSQEIRLALRLPYRSKPLNVINAKEFLDAVRYQEPHFLGSRRFSFHLSSFDLDSATLLKMILDYAYFPEGGKERNPAHATLDSEDWGTILAHMHELTASRTTVFGSLTDPQSFPVMPGLYAGTIEEPLRFSPYSAVIRFQLDYLETPAPKIWLKPTLLLGEAPIELKDGLLFESAKPGVLYKNVYYRFQSRIKRKHLRHLTAFREIIVPEPLFGTFIENSLPQLLHFAEISKNEEIEKIVTMPFAGSLKAICDIHYLNGELEASLKFIYDQLEVPASSSQLSVEEIQSFVSNEGVLARNLTEEQEIIQDLFQDFYFDASMGCYIAKTEKKIVEFMTEVIPRYQGKVKFNCPQNLLERFIYDSTKFKLILSETDRIDVYKVELKTDGPLKNFTVDQLWDCIASKRTFIEIVNKKDAKRKGSESVQKAHKILVLDLDKLAPVIQIFDELGINNLDEHTEERPLWSLASISYDLFEKLPITFSMTKRLEEIQQQMLGNTTFDPIEIPSQISATLRTYQSEGVQWLNRLRQMHLNGILADDMGLGKTLQAIIALTHYGISHAKSLSMVVCPTSLVYNWKEEINKFNPKLKVLAVDGTPNQRKKLQTEILKYDVMITSYSLLQKDIEFYKTLNFGYVILDEAQHIKNRGTRNAKSVKMIHAAHRLILTGTPIENSLDELWSLFDFLMPGLLSSYERFVEKYIRNRAQEGNTTLEVLRKKVSPFILRRMKKDVLSELPAVSEIVYHCHLSDLQKELYRSYAQSAREELSQLVKKEGFDKVQIQVLATLTRLKQICCHPAIFAKESAEIGDSAKYDMLIELLQSLIEAGHKTVIFSQYTRMLSIMRNDLEQQGIRFCYLDGSTKNRLSIVKQFNEDTKISVFLVSLKAGGTGLNLVGADTVIHYDMWWNPAVENQATDRVHRIGQKNSVSAYKLITLGTIEEKILELQNRKKSLVKKIISSDEEAIVKLTWEEVLELLQT